MATVAERVVDGAVLALIKQWLKAPVMGENDSGKTAYVGGGKGNRRGTPQGGVISPLLSNLYLHLMDRIWQRRELTRKHPAKLVRYADDFVVLCRKDVATPLAIIKQILERLELQLNESKTRTVDANPSAPLRTSKESFNFLGFELKMNVGSKGGRYPHIQPADPSTPLRASKAVKKVKTRIKVITARNRTGIPIPVLSEAEGNDVVRDLNRTLRGWSGYFHYRNSTAVFQKVKRHAEERLRIHLRKRHKVTDWKSAMIRFPRRVLYEQYGLYKISTVAGWKMAHAQT